MHTSANINHSSIATIASDVTNAARPYPTVAVVPVAGQGTRLRPLSTYIPKELLPVGGEIALWRIVNELLAAGVERVVFVVSPEKQAFVEKCFGSATTGGDTLISSLPLSPHHAKFEYVVQETMRGLGDAVLCAEHHVGDSPFVVALGDAVYEEQNLGGLTRRMIDAFMAHEAELALAVQPVPRERIQRYGIVAPTESFSASNAIIASQSEENELNYLFISDIVEKPLPEEAPSNLAAAARYVVTPDVFATLRQTTPDAKGEVQFTHALQTLLRSGKKGLAIPLHRGEVRHDIGSLDSYYRAFVTFALNDPELGTTFRSFLNQKLQEESFPPKEIKKMVV